MKVCEACGKSETAVLHSYDSQGIACGRFAVCAECYRPDDAPEKTAELKKLIREKRAKRAWPPR